MSSGVAMMFSNAPVFDCVGGRSYMGVASGAHGLSVGCLECVLSTGPPRRPYRC